MSLKELPGVFGRSVLRAGVQTIGIEAAQSYTWSSFKTGGLLVEAMMPYGERTLRSSMDRRGAGVFTGLVSLMSADVIGQIGFILGVGPHIGAVTTLGALTAYRLLPNFVWNMVDEARDNAY